MPSNLRLTRRSRFPDKEEYSQWLRASPRFFWEMTTMFADLEKSILLTKETTFRCFFTLVRYVFAEESL